MSLPLGQATGSRQPARAAGTDETAECTMTDMSVDRMSIGDFARATGLTPKALRLYDDMDLLVPAQVDEWSGYRYYSYQQLDQARLVAALRRIGMPLARIRIVLALPAPAAAAELTSYWRQVEADTRSRRRQVNGLVDKLRSKEIQMTTTTTLTAEVGHRFGQGGRDEQQDGVHLGTSWWAVADGFGNATVLADQAMTALQVEPEPTDAATVETAFVAAAAAMRGGTVKDGITLTAVALAGDVATIGHVGDSRAYLIRDGVCRQLTRDHSEVASLVEEGRLTEEEARLHERRVVINRALVHGEPAEPDLLTCQVAGGDRLVLTTDGVHALFDADTLAGLLTEDRPADEVAGRVEGAVVDAGAPDNYAVVVIDLGG